METNEFNSCPNLVFQFDPISEARTNTKILKMNSFSKFEECAKVRGALQKEDDEVPDDKFSSLSVNSYAQPMARSAANIENYNSSIESKKVTNPTIIHSENQTEVPKRRWNKAKDAELFKLIREICNHENISINEFIKDENLDTIYAQQVFRLFDNFKWKGTILTFKNRIVKTAKNQKLSRREGVLLRSLIKEQTKNNQTKVDFALLVNYFPGKSVE